MKLSQGIQEAYKRRWSMVNTFSVLIAITPKLQDHLGSSFGDETNLNIKSITSPDFVCDPIETFAANKWFIGNGKDGLYKYQITFIDEDQLSLYKKFIKIYNFTKNNYFDDAAMTITIRKDADWDGETDKDFMELGGSLVESVSNISFSNDTENQIAEFTVSFKCNKPEIK